MHPYTNVDFTYGNDTVLTVAAGSSGAGASEVVRLLIEAGANTDRVLSTAARVGNLQLVRFLLDRGIDAEASMAFETAAHSGQERVVALFLERGADVARLVERSPSLMATLAASGHADVLRTLANAGANVDTMNEDGRTPLLEAVHWRHRDSVTVLLASGADVETKAANGDTPLAIAAREGLIEIVTALVEAGANVNAPGYAGASPLELAIRKRHASVQQFLEARGARFDAELSGYRVAPEIAAYLVEHTDAVSRIGMLAGEFGIDPQVPAIPLMVELLRDHRFDEYHGHSFLFTSPSKEAISHLYHGDKETLLLLLQAIEAPDPGLRVGAARALGVSGHVLATEPLMRALGDADAEVRAAATESLGSVATNGGIEPLLAALGNTDAELRLAAAIALGALQNPAAIEPLERALNDQDSRVRAAAAGSLASVARGEAIDALLKAPDNTHAVTRALGKLEDSRGIPYIADALRQSIEQDDMSLQWTAIEAARALQSPELTEPLALLLEAKFFGTRSKAAKALWEIADARAIPALVAALDDPAWNVRGEVAEVLAKLGPDAGAAFSKTSTR